MCMCIRVYTRVLYYYKYLNTFKRLALRRLNCFCDDEFHRCLKNSKDGVGGKVGTVYFTLLGTQCFREDYPVVGCKSSTL